MRDNGLSATSYTPMGEVDPQLADAVLESLAEAGIAAYAKPSTGTNMAELVVSMPDRPMDLMYVDAAESARAREVIQRATEEAEWQSLIEQFNAPDGDVDDISVPRWPAAEDVNTDADEPDADEAERGDHPISAVEAANRSSLVAADDQRRADDDPRDHYVPPEPQRGPRLDWISRVAWTGLIGGPILLLLAAAFDVGAESRITLLALLGFAGGFLTLVLRMNDRLPIDDTPDDGAVV